MPFRVWIDKKGYEMAAVKKLTKDQIGVTIYVCSRNKKHWEDLGGSYKQEIEKHKITMEPKCFWNRITILIILPLFHSKFWSK